MNTKTDMTVANTIAKQIGNAALAMLGAKNLVGDSDSLTFRFQGCKSANCLRIKLEADDTYTMTFLKIRGVDVRTVEEVEGAHAEDMHRVIEQTTGLYTRL